MDPINFPATGYFFRTVDSREIEIFRDRPSEYGLPAPAIDVPEPTFKELAFSKRLKQYKCQKFFAERDRTTGFQAGREKLLVVDCRRLSANDWEVLEDPNGARDIAIKGEAVVRAGALIGFDDPLPGSIQAVVTTLPEQSEPSPTRNIPNRTASTPANQFNYIVHPPQADETLPYLKISQLHEEALKGHLGKQGMVLAASHVAGYVKLFLTTQKTIKEIQEAVNAWCSRQ